MIYCIINNIVPDEYFRYSRLWKNLKDNIFMYINSIFYDININSISCKLSGGRKYNYDFEITVHNNNNERISKNIEFKFNLESLNNCPQFIQLSSNFKLCNNSYHELFYDNYLKSITDLYNIDIIDKNIYLKFICQSEFNKNSFFNYLYNNEKTNDGKLIQDKKYIVDKSINDYIINNVREFDINKLTNKLLESQKNKIYMLYSVKKQTFIIDKIYDNELTLLNRYSLKKNKSGFVNKIIYETESGKTTIHMLLRWKNHAGILNPAWQISIKR
jgi:hypothetical protein